MGQNLQYFLEEIGVKEDDSGVLVLPASAIFNCRITASALVVTWNTQHLLFLPIVIHLLQIQF